MRIDRAGFAAILRHAACLLWCGFGAGAFAQAGTAPANDIGNGGSQAEQVFAAVSPKVWTVRAQQPQGNQYLIGSAVLIAPGRFITACHVVEKSIAVTLGNNGATLKVDEVLRDPDNRRDLCLLRVAGKFEVAPVQVAPISTLRVGQRVYVISSPRGLELSLTDGLISSLRQEPESTVPIIQSSTPVTSGSSGGGLFDQQGRLVGVVRSVATATENFAFSYPAEWVAQLPERYAKEIAAWQGEMKAAGVRFGADGSVVGSGYAALGDADALPVPAAQKAPVVLAYKQFLLLAAPRVFVFTSDGKFGSFSSSAEFARFKDDCRKSNVSFRLYAVDNAVVWQAPASASTPASAPAAAPSPASR
ncbi:S1 family peptidase [Burkholderia gladioli]|uniref:S1 family peptidase n=1 Tax=Burkholderia gladioli TaxID=28095 RepID=UPI00139C3468|nr:serine protease [Burkholderia gladioli]KAF1058294.1 Periplasmic serine endoprotease DegP [Burkholderia gladioli]